MSTPASIPQEELDLWGGVVKVEYDGLICSPLLRLTLGSDIFSQKISIV